MANTNDVTLRLRATLDTTQVKQQINELRKYQGTSGGTVKGPSSANTSSYGGVPTSGNLAVNINNAIVRLNQTLTQLNQSISRLSTRQGAVNTVRSYDNRMPYIGGVGSVSQIPELKKWQDNNFRDALKTFRIMDSNEASKFYNRMMSVNLNDPKVNHYDKFFAQQFQSRINPNTPYENFKNFLNSKEGQNYINGNNIDVAKFNRQIMTGFAGQYVLGGLQSNLQGYSFTNNPVKRWTGEIAGAGSQGVMTAAMFQMMFPKVSMGMVGAVGGGSAIASLIEAFGKMKVEKIQKSAEALRQANESFDVIYGTLKKINSLQYDKKIQGMSLGDLNSERSSVRKSFVKAEEEYYANAEDVKKRMEKLQRENIKYMSSHKGMPMANYSNAMQDLETELLSYKEEFEKQKEIFEKVNNAYDRHIQALDNMTNIIKNAEKFDKSISDFNNGRVINQLIKDGRVGDLTNQRNEIQTQISGVIGKLSVIQGMGGLKKYEEGTNILRQKLLTTTDEAEKASLRELIRQREKLAESYKENAEEMMKLTQKMDGLDNSIEQIKEASKSLTQSADSIIKSYTDRDESNALKTALYGIQYGANGRDLGKAPILQFREASKLLDHYREMMRQKEQESINLANKSKNEDLTLKEREDLIELSEKAKDEASRFASLVGQVESFISGINTNLQKPDLSNVTSLGQYGFSMGEKNDNINRLQKYYDNVENLVEQIRNKLNEGLKTTNTYN